MAGPNDVPVRQPVVAGMFYPDDPAKCTALARKLIEQAAPTALEATRWIGGIVPHAGWICSGAIAAETIARLAGAGNVDVVVVFGAVHTPLPLDRAVLDGFEQWQVPGEASHIATELRRRVMDAVELFRVDNRFHLREHAVEVELPLIQQVFSGAAILPVEVPLLEDAVAAGKTVAREVIEADLRGVFLASSDLTHYGPAYRFAPAGVGASGLEWATSNDRRLLDLIEQFKPEQVVGEVGSHSNACGGGAIAAMMSACRELGAASAKVLRHSNSYQTLREVAPQPADNAVGYASVVVG